MRIDPSPLSSGPAGGSRSTAPLSSVIPPLILGTATFNFQYNDSPVDLPSVAIVRQALAGPRPGFDTSPYYGPSEMLLGQALRAAATSRDSYFLATKAGRIGPAVFDYSAPAIRASVLRSLGRLGTSYLDLVYCHDVEFVSPEEVVCAVQELRRLRDEGIVHYVGISGYPVHVLTSLAARVLQETGEPLDGILSYSNFCVQNTTLGSDAVLQQFRDAKVNVLLNGSILSMGLLTTRGIDASPMASWHPSPPDLRKACQGLSSIAREEGRGLEEVSIRWAMAQWAEMGSTFGASRDGGERIGVTVIGVSSVAELEQTTSVWQNVLDGKGKSNAQSVESAKVREIVEKRMWPALSHWQNFTWDSPGEGFVKESLPE